MSKVPMLSVDGEEDKKVDPKSRPAIEYVVLYCAGAAGSFEGRVCTRLSLQQDFGASQVRAIGHFAYFKVCTESVKHIPV